MTASPIVTVSGRTTDVQGRFLVSAGTNHFVTDSRGGPDEAVQAGELLLSSLASCALGNIQTHARERGADLARAAVTVSFERDPDDATRYRRIRLDIHLEGVRAAEGRELVRLFTSSCPIYNTLRRGGTTEVALTTTPPPTPSATDNDRDRSGPSQD
ncbi:OsmC family protein [Yinghuangia sp. ASG 101]|uniref:OsmC family protein n=1 Tax=Yinghuangia sp. ASG 101 TaxID=2896848 RepID=UPI001E29CCBF|nr:OsmC family protein [Yinghuangia sp. ASG 101]UGQ11560.1 OsmC family protein [Yinghuangia sp. ASG 101]